MGLTRAFLFDCYDPVLICCSKSHTTHNNGVCRFFEEMPLLFVVLWLLDFNLVDGELLR